MFARCSLISGWQFDLMRLDAERKYIMVTTELSVILEKVCQHIKKYVVVDDEAIHAIACFIVATRFLKMMRYFPWLMITSIEPGCGKTVLLSLVCEMSWDGKVVPKRMSPESFWKGLKRFLPTIGIEDIHLKPKVIQFLSEGTEKTAGGSFGAGVGNGIGIDQLDESATSRAIVVRLHRHQDTGFYDQEDAESVVIREEINNWAKAHEAGFQDAIPVMPSWLENRNCLNWKPLFKVAFLAGQEWLARIEYAAKTLVLPDDDIKLTLAMELFDDIVRALQVYVDDTIPSESLLEKLGVINPGKWAKYKGNKPLTKEELATLLRPYGIKSKSVWCKNSGKALRGYDVCQLKSLCNKHLQRINSSAMAAISCDEVCPDVNTSAALATTDSSLPFSAGQTDNEDSFECDTAAVKEYLEHEPSPDGELSKFPEDNVF